MHSMDNYYVSKLIPLMAEAGVSVVANPLINITLQGRHDTYPKRRAHGRTVEGKHKDLAANARGKLFGKLVKDIMVAARGGADPAGNARLRLVVEQARKVSMPKDTLDRAIKKGAGLTGEAVHFEHVIYEGFAPHRCR
jgi:hypothetical protein